MIYRQKHLFLTIPEAGKSKMEAPADTLSTPSRNGQKGKEVCSHCFYKDTNHIWDDSQHLAEPEFKWKFPVDLKPKINQVGDTGFLQLVQS